MAHHFSLALQQTSGIGHLRTLLEAERHMGFRPLEVAEQAIARVTGLAPISALPRRREPPPE